MPAVVAERVTKVFGRGETAVVNDPALVLADEPTAALDTERGPAVMALLRRLGRQRGAAVVVVTHDERMVEGFDRVYRMLDGRIADDRVTPVGASHDHATRAREENFAPMSRLGLALDDAGGRRRPRPGMVRLPRPRRWRCAAT
jgi:energy-coupling factor transporter ATP-binding protein EcfA2